jgi:hypothetical protein
MLKARLGAFPDRPLNTKLDQVKFYSLLYLA